MTWIEDRLLEWEWYDETRVSPILLREFEEKLAQFQRSLDEKVAIDRTSAKMFEYTMRKRINWETTKTLKLLPLAEDFLLSVAAIETKVSCIGHNFTQLPRCPVDQPLEKLKKDELLPKETIVIKKDVINFIKDCIRAAKKLPKPRLLLHVSEVIKYLMDVDDAKVDSVGTKDSREVPPKIYLPKDSDQELISEELSVFEELTGTVHEMQYFHKLEVSKRRFELDVIQLVYLRQKFNLEFPKWIVSAEDIDLSYLRYLEDLSLNESLTKGAEYFVDAPFMSTKPTFKEPMSSFELAASRVTEKYAVDPLPEVSIIKVFGAYNEDDVLYESIQDEMADLDPGCTVNLIPLKFVDDDHLAVEGEVSSVPYRQVLKSILFEVETIEGPSLTKEIELSNVQVLDSTAVSHETTKNDCFNATRMGTLGDTEGERTTALFDITEPNEGQQMSLSKRSLDDDLDALISKKRRAPTDERAEDLSEIPALRLLKESKADVLATTEVPIIEAFNTAAPVSKVADVQMPESFKVKRTVIMNSSNLSDNHHLLKFIDRCCSIDVVEFELGYDQPDFLCSFDSGIALLSSSSIEQADLNGNLYVQDQIIQMKLTVPNLQVVIMITNISYLKKESLLNFQLMLALMDIKSLVVEESDLTGICEQICLAAQSFGGSLDGNQLEIMESNEASFLLDLGVNPFAAMKVLSKCNILDFLLASSFERSKIVELPQKVSELVDELLNVSWSFE